MIGSTAEVGVGRSPEVWTLVRPSCRRTAREAQAAEQEWWDGILVPDSQNLAADALVQLSLCASSTERLLLGTGVTNPVTRHPAVLAGAMATLQDESRGRMVLGIGRGDSAVAHIGYAPAPLGRFERYLDAIQTYLRGGDLPFDGEWVAPGMRTLDQLTLGTAPSGSALRWLDRSVPKVPVDVAASGAKVIRLGATLGDRVTFSLGADPSRIRWALDTVRAAQREVGRPNEDVSIGAYVVVAISDDQDEARSLAVAGGLASFSRHAVIDGNHAPSAVAGDLAVEAELAARYDMNVHGRPDAAHLDAFTPQFVDRNAVAGTIGACVARLKGLWEMGVDHFVIIERSEKVGAAKASHEAVVSELLPEMHRWTRNAESARSQKLDDVSG